MEVIIWVFIVVLIVCILVVVASGFDIGGSSSRRFRPTSVFLHSSSSSSVPNTSLSSPQERQHVSSAASSNNNKYNKEPSIDRIVYDTIADPAAADDDDRESLLLNRIDNVLHEYYGGCPNIIINKESILRTIDQQHANDVMASCSSTSILACEQQQNKQKKAPSIPYEWIYTPTTNKHRSRKLAIRTTNNTDEPILNSTSISMLLQAAEEQWFRVEDTSDSQSSRFTYQRKGNYEVHLSDLCTTNPMLRNAINEMLVEKIYPTIRHAFLNDDDDDGDSSSVLVGDDVDNELNLCIYDAIVIRYNATEANVAAAAEAAAAEAATAMDRRTGSGGAGQPLHRDLGLVSANIMLNTQKDFDGGGTFFEDQLVDAEEEEDDNNNNIVPPNPLKPLGPGHAIMHRSNDRHAGAKTESGVRDILVLFVTATASSSNSGNDIIGGSSSNHHHHHQAPGLERSARLKSLARFNCDELCCGSSSSNEQEASCYCRSMYHKLAVQSNPKDGEAWHYLGMALWDVYKSTTTAMATSNNNNSIAKASIDCLQHATKLTPCDARLFNNLGLTYDKYVADNIIMTAEDDNDMQHHQHSSIIRAYYKRALFLNKASLLVGCADIQPEHDANVLNYGLYLANRDEFPEAISILEQILGPGTTTNDNHGGDNDDCPKHRRHLRIYKDAMSLLRFCQNQV